MSSIILGRLNGSYLEFPGEENVALYAPTRSGKGVSCVIPNCLHWPDSLVCLDVKGENWRETAGYRARKLGQNCFLFDPLSPDGRTARWNPLSFVDREADDRFDQIQRVAQSLFPESMGTVKFWDDAGRFAFAGVAGLVAERAELPLDVPTILGLFSSSQATPVLRASIARALEQETPHSRAVVESVNDYLTGGAELVNGIRKSVTTRLALWHNPRIAAATATSDFDLARLRADRMSVYVKVAPADIERLRPLLALFFQQLVALNSRVVPQDDPSYRHQCLLLLDEFPTLGPMPVLADAFAFIAGYGIRILVVCQSPSQIRSQRLYGHEMGKNIIANCGAEIVFGTKDPDLARELSERTGSNTVEQITRHRPRWFGSWAWNKQTEGRQPHGRALVLPQEVLHMDRDKEMIFRAGMPTVLADRIKWYEDPTLSRRRTKPPEQRAIEVVVPMDDGTIGGMPVRQEAQKVKVLDTMGQREHDDSRALQFAFPEVADAKFKR